MGSARVNQSGAMESATINQRRASRANRLSPACPEAARMLAEATKPHRRNHPLFNSESIVGQPGVREPYRTGCCETSTLGTSRGKPDVTNTAQRF